MRRTIPYGDGISPIGLSAVRHVQEVRMPAEKDYEAVKQTVYLHGGVESSLYVDFSDPREPRNILTDTNF